MPHYYDEHQNGKISLKRITATILGNNLTLLSSGGVFSSKKIDYGSKLLVERCVVKKNQKILDMGCGYGVIGIALAKAYPTINVVMVDINRRAVKLAKMNVKLNGIKNAVVRQGNLYGGIKEKFDGIVVNPPQSAGKDVCYKITQLSLHYGLSAF